MKTSRINNLFWKRLEHLNNRRLVEGIGWSVSKKYIFFHVPENIKEKILVPKVFKGRLIVYH